MTEPKQKPGRSKQDYATPWAFIDAVKSHLGLEEFSIDLAADETNAKAPRWISREENALADDECWEVRIGARRFGWLNPPFSNIGQWAKRCAEVANTSEAGIAMLVPASVGSNWYRDYVHYACAHTLFLNGRITFDGTSDPFPKDLMLVLYGYTMRGNSVWSWRKGVSDGDGRLENRDRRIGQRVVGRDADTAVRDA